MKQLSGMTGFARVNGQYDDVAWTWEARSVNGKGLDLRLRLPSDVSALEGRIRKAFGAVFHRGNIQISLSMQTSVRESSYEINAGLIDALESFALERGGVPELGQLLQVVGAVIESHGKRDEAEQAALEAALLSSAQDLSAELKHARDGEGAALSPILSAAVDNIQALTANAERRAAEQPEALRDSFKTRLTELLSSDIGQERIAQEAAILALKADIREELDRLAAHCEQARMLLEQGSPVGRKLDFLCQEFNREINTLCSKSTDIDLTRIGLSLKSSVEQFREQAANVE